MNHELTYENIQQAITLCQLQLTQYSKNTFDFDSYQKDKELHGITPYAVREDFLVSILDELSDLQDHLLNKMAIDLSTKTMQVKSGLRLAEDISTQIQPEQLKHLIQTLKEQIENFINQVIIERISDIESKLTTLSTLSSAQRAHIYPEIESLLDDLFNEETREYRDQLNQFYQIDEYQNTLAALTHAMGEISTHFLSSESEDKYLEVYNKAFKAQQTLSQSAHLLKTDELNTLIDHFNHISAASNKKAFECFCQKIKAELGVFLSYYYDKKYDELLKIDFKAFRKKVNSEMNEKFSNLRDTAEFKNYFNYAINLLRDNQSKLKVSHTSYFEQIAQFLKNIIKFITDFFIKIYNNTTSFFSNKPTSNVLSPENTPDLSTNTI